MSERPIIFSPPMARAILDGRKSQTRRVVKDVPPEATAWRPILGDTTRWTAADGFGAIAHIRCPYGQPGDTLWAREAFYIDTFPEGPVQQPEDMRDVYYRADGECCEQIPECQCFDVGKPRWRPSIYMPRWASRLTLRVTEVRVERLQAISEDDARAEGAAPRPTFGAASRAHCDARDVFAAGWDAINGKRLGCSWADNPWVWCVSFEAMP
jgi:hypothetical protein